MWVTEDKQSSPQIGKVLIFKSHIDKMFFGQITDEQSVISPYFIDNSIIEVEWFEPERLFWKYKEILIKLQDSLNEFVI